MFSSQCSKSCRALLYCKTQYNAISNSAFIFNFGNSPPEDSWKSLTVVVPVIAFDERSIMCIGLDSLSSTFGCCWWFCFFYCTVSNENVLPQEKAFCNIKSEKKTDMSNILKPLKCVEVSGHRWKDSNYLKKKKSHAYSDMWWTIWKQSKEEDRAINVRNLMASLQKQEMENWCTVLLMHSSIQPKKIQEMSKKT